MSRFINNLWQSNYLGLMTIFLVFLNPVLTSLAEAKPDPSDSVQEIFDIYPPIPNQKANAWAFAFENDVLVGGNRDKDYTYGLNVSFRGDNTESFFLNPYPVQRFIEGLYHLPHGESSGSNNHFLDEENLSLEFGIYSFTPDEIETSEVVADDRPYASLVYLESSKERLNPLTNSAWTSSLSIGFLGTNLAGSAQNSIHKLTGSQKAEGWGHQISNGGELTAKYTLSRQEIMNLSSPSFELKTSSQASIGYLTEFSYGLSFRFGKIRSAWWGFDPDLASYGERSNNSAFFSKVQEHYVWGGITFKYRAYNAFLQGQFRNSDHEFSSDELNHQLVEAWLGYTLNFNHGYRISYYIRGHSSEIKHGTGNRNLLWGGLILSKSL